MSYSLTPIIVDLNQVKSLMGSKDTKLLQAVIKKFRQDMLGTDEIGEFFDDFEAEIKAEYRALVAGDFSGVDLKATYPERQEDDEDDEDDEEMAEMKREFESLDRSDPDAIPKFVNKHLTAAFMDADWDDVEEEDAVEPVREITTGAALVQLVMGGTTNSAHGYKYGYALCNLCEYLGEVPDHDSWCTIRYRTVDAIDAVLKKAGVKPKLFSASTHLVNRGSPVDIPKPADFPAIGYLTRDEVPKVLAMLDPEKVESAIRGQKADADYFRGAIGELRSWLEACVKTKRDLICFYY